MSDKAKFVKQLAVTEYVGNRKNHASERFEIAGTPDAITELQGVEDGDAVAIYELKTVTTYRTEPRLDKD